MAEALGFDPHDPGRRAHYGEFYGLTELPDAPIFMVHGNCQAESLRVLLHGAGRVAGTVCGFHRFTSCWPKTYRISRDY